MDVRDLHLLISAYVELYISDAAHGLAGDYLKPETSAGKWHDDEERHAWCVAYNCLDRMARGSHRADRLLSIAAAQLGREPKEVYQALLIRAQRQAEQYQA